MHGEGGFLQMNTITHSKNSNPGECQGPPKPHHTQWISALPVEAMDEI